MRRSGWLAVLAIGACHGARAPERPPHALTPPTQSVSSEPTVEVAAPHIEPEVTPPTSDSSDATLPEPSTTAALDASVEIEAPYSALGHPELATEMLTLGRDAELLAWALGGSSDPDHPANRQGYHPATRVVIDVSLQSRAPVGTTRRLVAKARRNGYWLMRACFETAERLHPARQREVRARLTLSSRGKVLAARLLEKSTTHEPAYTRCALQNLRRLNFDVELPRKLDVEIHVEQWRGDAPLPPRAPAAERSFRLGSDAIAALRETMPALRDCYRSELAKDRGLWGRLALRVEIGSEGDTTRVEQVETRFPNEAVVECARRVLLGTRIPAAGASFTFAARFGQPGAPPLPLPAMDSEGAPAPPGPPAAPAAPPPPASQ